MKKFVRLIACLLMVATSVAANAEFRWGATLGTALTNLKFKQDLVSVDKVWAPQVGITGEMMFPGIGFGIDVGAYYAINGAKVNFSERPIWSLDGYGDQRIWMHSLTIPIDLRFKWTRMGGIEDYIAPYIFGGPVFDFCVAHNKVEPMSFAVGSIGLQCGFGVELYKRWQIQGSYTWGMTYALKAVKLMDYSARNRALTLKAIYYF